LPAPCILEVKRFGDRMVVSEDLFEQAIIRRCQQGDREAFRWLVQRYSDIAIRVAYLQRRNQEAAEDAVQEAFLNAWKAMPTFQPGRPFRPWLLKIVLNQCYMAARRKQPTTVSLETTIDVAQSIHADQADPEAVFVQNEARAQLHQLLTILPDDQRQVIELRFFADLSVPEIATILDCRQGTVKSRLHRGLASLRSSWHSLATMSRGNQLHANQKEM